MVSAFEQSLEAMKRRLNAILNCSEQKDMELQELRHNLENVYQFCRGAGLNVDHIFSPNIQRRHTFNMNAPMDSGKFAYFSVQNHGFFINFFFQLPWP